MQKNYAHVLKAIAILICVSCATKAPIEHQQALQAVPAAEVDKPTTVDAKRDAVNLEFKKSKTEYLDDKSPVMSIGKTRSYYKTFKIEATGTDHFIEIKSFPYKPLGFGQIGIIHPLLLAYTEEGKPHPVADIHADYDHSFIDGDYFRAVWRLRNLTPKKSYYLVVAAKTDIVGQKGKDLPNYGGAVVGVVMTHSVQFSPVGKFAITQTDSFSR